MFKGPLPYFLKAVSKQLAANKSGSGWFVGESLTVADLKVFFVGLTKT